ncbi:MAG: GFA family protein [Steroidobacteraceae bacterium]
MPYQGSCHCGALTYVYRTDLPPEEWSIRACQCSFCRAHGAQSTSDPQGTVAFQVQQPERLRRYRFGHRVTEFLICAHCGVYVGALAEISGSFFAIINVNALRPRPAGLKEEAAPVSHDGESAQMRNQRRRNGWTPCTGIPSSAQG